MRVGKRYIYISIILAFCFAISLSNENEQVSIWSTNAKSSTIDTTNIIFDITRMGTPFECTQGFLNLTATEHITSSDIFYEFEFELEIYLPEYVEGTYSDPLGLQFICLENQTVYTYIRYVNETIPKGEHGYISGTYEFNTTRPIDCAEVTIKTVDGGRVSKEILRNQHAIYDRSSYHAIPMLVSTPNMFEYTLDIQITDGINLTHHTINNEVFWPNTSDNIAFGILTARTSSQTPVNSVLFDTMNWSFDAIRCISSTEGEYTGTTGFPEEFEILPPNESDYHEFVWHTLIENDNGINHFIPSNYHYAKGDRRFFIHEYEIWIGTFDNWGYSVDLEFGIYDPIRKIPGFQGMYLVFCISIIAIVGITHRKLSGTKLKKG